MNNPKPCIMYLVRHGQSEANVQELFGLDTPLTLMGKKQARTLSNLLKNVHFEAIFSSDLIRAKQTAEIIALEHKITVQTKDLLKERYWGELEGKDKITVRAELRELFEKAKTMEVSERVKYKIVS